MKGKITRVAALCAALLALFAQAEIARAITIVVNDLSDALDVTPGDGACATGTGTCTLRAAIQEANALPGSDLIVLPAGTINLLRSGADDTALNGDLDISTTLVISGAGTTINGSTWIGSPDRIFHVLPGGDVLIKGVTIKSGKAQLGGGILNNGALTLWETTVYTNSATSGGGGGINTTGALTMAESRLLDNADWATLVAPPKPFNVLPYAYAVKPGDEAWLAQVDEFVARIQRDGRLEAAARKHGLGPIVRLN